MQLRKIGNNETEVILPNGHAVLFSYNTPVAGLDSRGFFRTEEQHSKTTSRHINKYLGGAQARTVTQEYCYYIAG